jgi:hypothetical protein
VNPGVLATQIQISLEPAAGNTRAIVRYTYTALSPEGNREVEHYDETWFKSKMQGWEAAINHYLRTGTLIDATARE